MTNITLLALYIAFCILISIILSKHSYIVQSIAIILLAIIAIISDKLLLHFFRDYFIKQWYYSSSYSWKTGYGESIVIPFIFIGGIIYALVQVITFKIKTMKRR